MSRNPEMEMGRTCGKTPEQHLGADFYNVGPLHRQKAMRQTSKQMDGLLQEDRRSALVQSCKKSKQLENSTERAAERRTVDHEDQDNHVD